jgi:hypothetical protein
MHDFDDGGDALVVVHVNNLKGGYKWTKIIINGPLRSYFWTSAGLIQTISSLIHPRSHPQLIHIGISYDVSCLILVYRMYLLSSAEPIGHYFWLEMNQHRSKYFSVNISQSELKRAILIFML